jgi:hypothetical protein
MCGIVGFFGKLNKARLDAFEEMFLMDVVRGTDSVGVAVIRKDDVEVVKDCVWPEELINSEEYYEAIVNRKYSDVVGLIGHNRFATRGGRNVKNAHPFQHGSITMVHNGTTWPWRLPAPPGKFDTDSEVICHGINEWGIQKAWPCIDGPATLVFWNNETKKLNVVTNGERPFYFLYLKGLEGMMFASEPWMLHAACIRFNIKVAPEIADHFYLIKDTLYEFSFEKGKIEMNSSKLTPFREPVRQRAPTVVHAAHPIKGNFNGRPGWWHGNDFVPEDDARHRGMGMWNDYGEDFEDLGERTHHESCTCHECLVKWADGGAEVYHPSMPDPNLMAIRIPDHPEGCLCMACDALRQEKPHSAAEQAKKNAEENVAPWEPVQSFRHAKGCDCMDCKVAIMHPRWCDCVRCQNFSKEGVFRDDKPSSLMEKREQHLRQNNHKRHNLLSINIFRKTVTAADWKLHYRNCCSCGDSLQNEYTTQSMILNYDKKQALCSSCVKTGLDSGMGVQQLESMVTVH